MTYETYMHTYIDYRSQGMPFDKCGACSGSPQLIINVSAMNNIHRFNESCVLIALYMNNNVQVTYA